MRECIEEATGFGRVRCARASDARRRAREAQTTRWLSTRVLSVGDQRLIAQGFSVSLVLLLLRARVDPVAQQLPRFLTRHG
jgi:hypothetical protein